MTFQFIRKSVNDIIWCNLFLEGAVLGWSTEERLSKCEEIQQIMNQSGFPSYMKGLEEVYPSGPLQFIIFHPALQFSLDGR